MAKITNPNYKKFLNGDVIYHIDYDDLAKILSNIKGEYADMGKALVVLLYYTGARPAEALLLKTGTRVNGARDPIERDGNHIIVNMPSVKRGKERKLRIPLKKPFVDVLYKYSISMPPSSYYFHYYMGNHERTYNKINGQIATYREISYKLRYWFKKWTKDLKINEINPYYLRHDLFTKFMEKGANESEIKLWKGCTTDASVIPYLHFSKNNMNKLAKML
jgi:integrase